jgi:hypothetical protein
MNFSLTCPKVFMFISGSLMLASLLSSDPFLSTLWFFASFVTFGLSLFDSKDKEV